MKKVIDKIFIAIFIFIIAILIQNISKAAEITSNYYKVDNDKNIISRIEPETTVETLKSKISYENLNYGVDEEEIQIFKNSIEIYKDETLQEKVTEGFVGTGMYLQYEDKEYELSVVGDFDGDGKATQVELTNTIRHIVGLQGATLEGIKYESADLTGDGQVDQRDITKFIRYIVYGELDLGKQDTTAPIVDIELIKQAVSEITVKGLAIDRESGMGEKPTFTFYVKKENESENNYKKVQSGEETLLYLTNLEQNTTYNIKVETQDLAGNKGEAVIKVRTGKIPDGTEQGAIIFGETDWENEMASITIETKKIIPIWEKETGDNTTEKFQIEYQVNGTNGVWKKGEYVTGLKHGDILYARLTDGTNSGTFIFKNIIDDIEPEIEMNVIADDEKLTATATVIKVEDYESGIDTKPIYTFYIKQSNEPDTSYKEIQKSKDTSCNFTNLTPNTKYKIKVEVKDKAENIGKAEQEIEIQGQQVPDATESGAIIFGKPQWSKGQAKVEISTSTKFIIEYQVNGTSGTWIRATGAGIPITATGLNHNDIIYARLTDGTNTGNYTTLTIIDNIIPDLEVITNVKSTTEIKAEATAVDNETGIDTAATYKFYIKKASEADTSYTLIQDTTSTICNFTGLIAGETYTIKVEIEDIAGNVATKIVTETLDNLPDGTAAGSIIFSSLTWTSGSAEVTISTNTEYTIEYQVNGISGTWTKGIAPKADVIATGLKHGDIIYARLTDGTSSGSYVTLTVIDTIKPDVDLTLNALNQTITATANAKDLESGIATDVTYKFYMKETGTDDSTYVEKQNTTSNVLTVPGLTVGKNYTIKVEVQDMAGNIGIQEKSIIIPDDEAPIVDLKVISKTSNSAEVQATATDVGGLPTPTIYVFYIKETGTDDSTYVEIQNGTSDTCTFTGLIQDKDYTVKVEVADAAGNIGKKERSILTDSIPDATQAGAINFESLTWNLGKAEVVISTKTSYYIEYQVNGTTGAWTRATTAGTNITATNLNHNDIIYARLTDGTSSSSYATLTVLDTKAPIMGLSTTATTSEITATVTAVDNETGMGTAPTYKFSIKTSTTSYIEKYNGTNATYKFTGLTAGETYTIKVETQDLAGNVATKETTITTKTIPTATGSITFGAIVWNSGKANISISTTAADFYIEYQVNGTSGTWTRASSAGTTVAVTGLNNGDIIYARLTDGTSSGSYASTTIIDTIEPEAFTITVTDITATGLKISGSTVDNQSGLKDYTYVIEKKGGTVTSASTKAKSESNNINRVSYNSNNSTNTNRSNNINT